jgi:hypothetical protein
MTLNGSKSMNLSSVSRVDFQERMQVGAVLHSTVLPQTQAGIARWSETRLCLIPTGALNQMTPDHFGRNVESPFSLEETDKYEGTAANSVARSKIGEGARAVNRLVWSLWLLLLPLFWPSSDWVGLIILSQAFFVAAKLIQPALSKTKSAASPVNAVMGIERGEDCAQG